MKHGPSAQIGAWKCKFLPFYEIRTDRQTNQPTYGNDVSNNCMYGNPIEQAFLYLSYTYIYDDLGYTTTSYFLYINIINICRK